MKNLFIFSFSVFAATAYCQNLPDMDALEDVIVEKYYVAGPNDQSNLPAGATTYRVFLDLKPGYEVQIIQGTIPHPLTIGSQAGFYNSEFGTTFGSDFLPLLLNFGTAALDSYVTMKAATQAKAAIPKPLDTDGSILTGDGGFLQNNDPSAGLPLLQADGLLPLASDLQPISQLSTPSGILAEFFGISNSVGTEFLVENTAWFNLDGVKGDTDENIVLIGQFTTLSCEFNFKIGVVQVIIPEDLQTGGYGTIRFVAETHPEDAELNASGDNFYIYQTDLLDVTIDSSCLVSVSDNTPGAIGWSIMPNPASDHIHVSLPQNIKVFGHVLYDVHGRVISREVASTQNAAGTMQMDITKFTPGIYLLQLITDQGPLAKKFMIAR